LGRANLAAAAAGGQLEVEYDEGGQRHGVTLGARQMPQRDLAATAQQRLEHDLAMAIERAKMAEARATELRNALEVERQRAEAAEAARDAAQATAARAQRRESFECGRLLDALPSEEPAARDGGRGEPPALVGVPNVGLTCHLGACVVALRHVHGFCGLVEDSSSAR
jgi:hypothetical protein